MNSQQQHSSRPAGRGRSRLILYLLALICVQYCAHFVVLFEPSSSWPSSSSSWSWWCDPLLLVSSSEGGAAAGVVVGGGNDYDNNNNNKYDPSSSSSLYALASGQSYGFFYDVTDHHWNLLRQLYRNHSNHLDPDRPLMFNPHNEERRGVEVWGDPALYRSYTAWYQSNYEPNFSCQFEKRVGINMNGEGPKWVCDPHRIKKLASERKSKDPTNSSHPGCVVYSIGSGGSFVFELGMQNEVGVGTCEYHIFDMGDYSLPPELERAHYHRWGLTKQQGGRGSNNNNDAATTAGEEEEEEEGPIIPGRKYYGLRDTIRLLGHEDLDVIDVFKIDCENCEWETYVDWLADDIPLLHQLQVEVHGAPGMTAVDFFDSLEKHGYLRFHKEPNIQYSPSCIEYAFVRVETSFMED